MTNKAMAYAWETPLKGTQKLMLLAIADRADDFGECYPGVAHFAKKCGISKRAAQKIIGKLEAMGELVIHVAAGLKTGSGCTNRYYMKKFRDLLNLETPVLPARDVQSDTPSDGQGVSKVTPQGVSKVTPNTTVDTKEEKKKDIAPVGASISQADEKQPSKTKSDEVDKQRNITARGLIAVYLKITKTIKSNAYALWQEEAQALADAGITPAHVADWLKYYISQDWWTNGYPKWDTLCAKIITWCDERGEKPKSIQRSATLEALRPSRATNLPKAG